MLKTKTLSTTAARLGAFLLPVLLSASAALAQVGTPFVSIADQGAYSFSNASAWAGNAVPGDSANITIANNTITMDVDKVVGTITLGPGGYLILSDATVTILDQLICNQLNGVYDDGGTSTVILKSTVADGGSGTVTIGGSNDIILNKVEVFAGSVVDFDSGGEGNTEVTITNQLKMGGGSVVVNPPIYGGASTLLYDATYATVGTEWTANATSGKGVPHHVSIGSSGSLSFGSTSSDYTCTGNFSVDDASGSLTLSSMLGDLTVDGDFTSGTNSAVTINMPTESGKGNLIVGGNMTLAGNTTWTGDEGNVTVGGNLSNSVTGGAAFGLLKFNGSADQDITGNLITVDSLVVAHTGNTVQDDTDVDFQANVDITPGGVFNPVSGTTRIDPTITFTMNSDANGTARIATLRDDGTSDVHLPSGVPSNGEITFERYIEADAGVTWLAAGNYVVGATLGDWSTSFGSDFFLTFKWDETHILNNSASSNGASWWSTITDTSTALEDSEYGYFILTMPNSNPTLTASGGYNTSQVNLALTLSSGAFEGGGWHLLTNPYPSPIDGAQFLSDNSTIISAYQLYDNSSDVFTVSGTNAVGTIDIGQSFWVQVGSAGTLSFNVDQITHVGNTFVREVDPLEEALVGIRIEQENGRGGNTYFRFHENGTPEYEWELDVTYKRSNPENPEIYTQLENGHELVINSMGALASVESIPLVVKSGSEGTVSISLDDNFPLPAGVCMLLEDVETGEVIGLGGDPMVVDLEPNTTFTDRFVVNLMDAPIFEATASHCEGGVVHFVGENAGLWNIAWSDMYGGMDGDMDGIGCVTGLATGDYVFEATNPLDECHTEANLSIEEVCMGDFNFNSERDITDLLILLVGIQPVNNFEGTFPETDCDCDGLMTTLDLLMFLPTFGATCE